MTPFVGPIFLANNLSDQAMASDNAADFAGQQTTDLAIMATSLIPGLVRQAGYFAKRELPGEPLRSARKPLG